MKEERIPWEETDCEPGEVAAPKDSTGRLRDGLFKEMRRVMEIDEPAEDENPVDLFVPTPLRGEEAFQNDYLRTLSEYRYVRPEWNAYMWRTAGRNIFAQYAGPWPWSMNSTTPCMTSCWAITHSVMPNSIRERASRLRINSLARCEIGERTPWNYTPMKNTY